MSNITPPPSYPIHSEPNPEDNQPTPGTSANTPGPDHRAETPNVGITSPAVRRYIYLAIAAIAAVLIVTGVITQDQVNEWVQLTVGLVAILGNVLAAANTPPAK